MTSCITCVAIGLVACSPSTPPARMLTVDGSAVASCRAGHNATRDGIAVDIVLRRTGPIVGDTPRPAIARLRFTRQRLYASSAPDGTDDGFELECLRLERSWGGSMRADGTGYWRGMLDFACDVGRETTEIDRIAGRLELVCGDPSPAEIASLDRQRVELRAGSGTGPVPQ